MKGFLLFWCFALASDGLSLNSFRTDPPETPFDYSRAAWTAAVQLYTDYDGASISARAPPSTDRLSSQWGWTSLTHRFSSISPMAARATWKGYLKISLVNIPVKVFPATEASGAISFNQLHGECQTRIQQKRWCPNCNREVPNSEIVKGMRV